MCVCVCPPALLVSITGSLADDLTLLRLASNSRQNLLPPPNPFLSPPRCPSAAVPEPATLSVPHCTFSSPRLLCVRVSVTISSYPRKFLHFLSFHVSICVGALLPLSLSLSLSFCLFVSLSLSLPRALLSKQSGLYQDEPQPKQAKQKIWARKSYRASLPTGDAATHPPLSPPPTHQQFWHLVSPPHPPTWTPAWRSLRRADT